MALVSKAAYRKGRKALANGSSILLWFGLWLVNGYFTVVALHRSGIWIADQSAAAGYPAIAAFASLLALPLIGWTLHILGSMVEGKGWQDIRSVGVITFLLVLTLDICTTAQGILAIISAGEPVSSPFVILAWPLAFFLALAPEPMIVGHFQDIGVIER